MVNQKNLNLKDMLEKSGEKYGDKIAYKIKIDNKYKIYTHKEVREMIKQLGTALINIGLKGKKIAIIGENRYEWEIAYLAVVCGTGIVVPLDKMLPENELKSLLKRAKVDAIIYSKKYEETVKNIKNDSDTNLKYLISMDDIQSTKEQFSQNELIKKGKELLKFGDKSFINSTISNEDMSVILFTSGTTSAAKIVALSHKNICSNLMDIVSILDINSNDKFLSFLPLHHVFECTVGFLLSLYIGAETDFCDGIRHIVENLNEYGTTVITSVPAVYENIYKNIKVSLIKAGNWDKVEANIEKLKEKSMIEKREAFKDIHNILGGKLRVMLCGAAAFDPVVEKGYIDLGFNLIQGYGLTETSPVIAVGDGNYDKIGSVGKKVPSMEIEIRNINNEEIGEIWVKGPNVMLGYYGNEEATKEVMDNDWFNTGDLGRLDEDGYLYISGRKKNVIVLRNGKNIYPEELECLINKLDYVSESMIFGKKMSASNNDLKIFAKIVYNEDILKHKYNIQTENQINELVNNDIKNINKIIPTYKTIKGSILTKSPLIKTTTNKIKRQEELEIVERL